MVEALDDTRPANTTEAVEALFEVLARNVGRVKSKKGSKLRGRPGRSRQPENPACSGEPPDSPDEAK